MTPKIVPVIDGHGLVFEVRPLVLIITIDITNQTPGIARKPKVFPTELDALRAISSANLAVLGLEWALTHKPRASNAKQIDLA